jgi:hypothetical protein
MASELAPHQRQLSPYQAAGLPALVAVVGDAARFAWEEFFEGELPNRHTRAAYERAVRRFLDWCGAERATGGECPSALREGASPAGRPHLHSVPAPGPG